ncbi:MAG: alanine--tRNA ligase, partial [Sphingomonadales bacterium]|nr:alanine--tRNA ligase [Sphingomonadales bacterium]
KHNDLENVGYTARHHTFFEMLGNFSFGDYFKQEAIAYAWEFLTKELNIPESRLWVSVFEDDDEAADIWLNEIGVSKERFSRCGEKDNFWQMGDAGPCGPCTEIFYDHGEDIAGGPPGSPDEDGDRFIEIWNLVFMQYEQIDADTRVDLPKPSIDTGMGLERLAAVLQGKHNNYEVDTFQALINASQSVTGTKADGQMLAPHRVIADHLRASSFLIADGVLPSNEGRGYVLRRIMRRAMRQSHILGYNDLLMHQLVPALVTEMGQAYPELQRAQSLIQETLKLEEGRFKITLERGLRLLNDEVGKLGASDALPGDVAFKLYDTYGFPLDLTEDALRAQDRKVDVDGFSTAMERQKAEARASWKGSGAAATDDVWFDVKDKVGASEFLGYDANAAEGEVQAIIRDGKPVEQANKGDDVAVIMNQTTFYGESGGQMGDEGTVTSKTGAKLVVNDTKKQLGSLIIHMAHVNEGTLKVGDVADLMVDKDRRQNLRANHSVTHLMHEALRRVLGDHVSQKGSLVMPERLRFDFAHSKPMSDDEIQKVESDVNALIRANSSVATRLMTPDEAIKEGAMALFGEKYGDEVRMITIADFSKELCGGTHVDRTGDIGF